MHRHEFTSGKTVKHILQLTALCAGLALLLPVQSAKAQSGAQTPYSQKAKAKKKAVVTHPGPSPSGHPEWDVYVRGEYVGSDPDPRIRSTLRQEAVRNYGFR